MYIHCKFGQSYFTHVWCLSEAETISWLFSSFPHLCFFHNSSSFLGMSSEAILWQKDKQTNKQTKRQKKDKQTNKQSCQLDNLSKYMLLLKTNGYIPKYGFVMTFFRHQLKILRNIDSHMSHVETSNKVLTSSKHLNYWCWSFFLWLLLRRTVLIIDWPLEKSIDYWRSGEIQLCHYHRALLRCRSCRVRSQLERTGFYWKLWGRWIALFFF